MARFMIFSSFFFFSSRRRHTRWTGDWSSDVCSSDLLRTTGPSLSRDRPQPGRMTIKRATRRTTRRGALALPTDRRGLTASLPFHDVRGRDLLAALAVLVYPAAAHRAYRDTQR